MKLLDPDYCRKQAMEVGAQTEALRNRCVKPDLIRIARSYQLLAELAESRQKGLPNKRKPEGLGPKPAAVTVRREY
jgi:hypothetical protein